LFVGNDTVMELCFLPRAFCYNLAFSTLQSVVNLWSLISKSICHSFA